MTSTDLLGYLTLGIVFIAVLLAIFALVVPTTNKLGNRLMAAYLLILAITISAFFYHRYFTPPLVIEKLRDDINLLSAPLFYLFVLSVLYRDFSLRWSHLWHTLPFVLIFLLYVPRFYAVSEAERGAFFDDYFGYGETLAASIISHGQAIFYLGLVFAALFRYRKVLRENYSDSSAITHRWLWQTNVLLSVLFGFSAFKNIYKRFVYDYELVTWVRIGMVTLLLAFLSWLLFKTLLNPRLFRGVDSSLKPLGGVGAAAGAKEVEEAPVDPRFAHLHTHMQQERPYLSPSLTMRELAKQLDWPERELSVLINQQSGRHYFDFVNDYRIGYAKEILKDTANRKMTVLEILYAVGFNSKSSFNVAFKNRTGMTPTQFRKAERSPLMKD
jgi:AraC-like DNA-binding protein